MSLLELFDKESELRHAAIDFASKKSNENVMRLRAAAVEFGAEWNRIERAIAEAEPADGECLEQALAGPVQMPIPGDGT